MCCIAAQMQNTGQGTAENEAGFIARVLNMKDSSNLSKNLENDLLNKNDLLNGKT